MPIAVIPTCTVEITRTGSSISRSAARAPALSRAASAARRAVTTEYSPITKNAFAATRPRTARMRRRSLTRASSVGGSGEQLAQEGEAVDGDRVLAGGERAPHRRRGGDRLVLGGEGLDHDRAVVARGAQRVTERRPVDVVGARGAAVVGRGVHVGEPVAGERERRGEVLLLHVRVVGVDEQA